MAKKQTKRQYLKELDRLAPAIQRQFFKWVGERVGIADVANVERYVRSGNIEGIMQTAGITTASLGDLTESVRDAYKVGGAFEAVAAQVTFNIRSVGAETWLAKHSSQLVTGIVDSQRTAIQTALETGMRNGVNPRTTALDIIGRRNVAGKRTGGVVGLTGQQSGYVSNARAQLRSGDTESLRAYLTRKRRDRRFDHIVHKAILLNKPVPAATANKMTARYADRLLKLRGETIARTESIAAMNAARDQAWQQSVEEGNVRPEFITSTWSATMDPRTRVSHSGMNGQTREYGVPFNSPTGSQLMYPGDTSLGARPEDVVNCRCFLQRQADFIAEAAFLYGGRR